MFKKYKQNKPAVLSFPVASLLLHPAQLGVDVPHVVLLQHQLLLLLVQLAGALLRLLAAHARQPVGVPHLVFKLDFSDASL